MALLKIAGATIAAPTKYEVGIMDINKLERNANGDMIGERITTKIKLELAWTMLSGSEMSQLQNLLAPLFFSVEYLDPKYNSMKTITCYAGDRKGGLINFVKGNPTYKDFTVNIIQR